MDNDNDYSETFKRLSEQVGKFRKGPELPPTPQNVVIVQPSQSVIPSQPSQPSESLITFNWMTLTIPIVGIFIALLIIRPNLIYEEDRKTKEKSIKLNKLVMWSLIFYIPIFVWIIAYRTKKS